MTTSSPLRRRHRPHLREPGATYLVSFELHQDQPPLSEADRTRVLETMRHFDGTRFTLHAGLVLDRKAYAVVTPFVERPLERIVGGWKRWLSGLFGRDGRVAPFWKRGYFDRVMRGPGEVAKRMEQLEAMARGSGGNAGWWTGTEAGPPGGATDAAAPASDIAAPGPPGGPR